MYFKIVDGVLISIYVDDGLIVGPKGPVKRILDGLEVAFGKLKRKRLEKIGDSVVFVGVRITKIEGGYTLDQEALIEEIHAAADVTVDNYRSVLMRAAYVIVRTRGEFGWVLSALSAKQDSPSEVEVTKLKKLIQELYETKDAKVFLVADPKNTSFVVSSDASHASHDDLRGQGGISFKVRGATFHTMSKKLKEACLSATEAELVALISALREGLFFKELIEQMGLFAISSWEVEEDNKGVLELVKDRKLPARTRHLGIKLEFVRDVVEEGTFRIAYKQDPDADVLTKEYGRAERQRLAERIGVKRTLPPGKFRGSVEVPAKVASVKYVGRIYQSELIHE